MSRKKRVVERVSVIDDLTQNIEKKREHPVSTRIDSDAYQFLENLSIEAFKENVSRSRKTGEKVKNNPSVSNELYRCVCIVQDLASHYSLKSIDEINEKLEELKEKGL